MFLLMNILNNNIKTEKCKESKQSNVFISLKMFLLKKMIKIHFTEWYLIYEYYISFIS